jgi:hypothetical protein
MCLQEELSSWLSMYWVHAVTSIFSGPVHVWMKGTLTHCVNLTWCFIVPCSDSLPVLSSFLKGGPLLFLLPYQIVRDKRKVSLKIFKVNIVKIDTRWCFNSNQFQHDSVVAQNMYVEDDNLAFIMYYFCLILEWFIAVLYCFTAVDWSD